MAHSQAFAGQNVYGVRHPVKIIVIPHQGIRRIPANRISFHSSFTSVVRIWNYLPHRIKRSWKPFSRCGMPPDYSMFLDENISRFEKGQNILLTAGTGLPVPAFLAVLSSSPGEISILHKNQFPVFMTVFAQSMTDGIGSSVIECWNDMENDGCIFIDGLCIGKEYLVYCIASDRPLTEDCTFSESAGFRLVV